MHFIRRPLDLFALKKYAKARDHVVIVPGMQIKTRNNAIKLHTCFKWLWFYIYLIFFCQKVIQLLILQIIKKLLIPVFVDILNHMVLFI